MSKNESESQDSGAQYALYLRATTWAVALLRIEASILVVLAIYLAGASLVKETSSKSGVVGEILFALVGAVGLFLASRAFAAGKSFGRAPAVLANLIALGVSYFMYSGRIYITAIPLSLLAAATLTSALLASREFPESK